MQVGEQIKYARRAQFMTLHALAQAAGLTKGFISQVESGKSNPSLASLGRIAQALQVPLGALMDSNDHGYNPASPLSRELGPQLLAARNVYNEQSGLAQVTDLRTGSHFIATIPALSALVNEDQTPRKASGGALCVLLQGSLIIRQTSLQIRLTVGEVATWNAGEAYYIENRGAGAANALIFIPESCPLPLVVALPQAPVFARNTAGFAAQYEGPMRLVGMRARRQSEQGR